jgi:hypothetical protein
MIPPPRPPTQPAPSSRIGCCPRASKLMRRGTGRVARGGVDLRWPAGRETGRSQPRCSSSSPPFLKMHQGGSITDHRESHPTISTGLSAMTLSTSATAAFHLHPAPGPMPAPWVHACCRWVAGKAHSRALGVVLGCTMASSFLRWRRPRVKAGDIWISDNVGWDGGGRREVAATSAKTWLPSG